jgi:histidine triad (HIT) family protein
MPAASNPSCPFCDVLRGAGEVSMCYEDRDVVAFMDIQPVNAGHVLVVPRQHYESLEDIPHSLATHLFDVAMLLAPVVKQVGDADGLNILVNSGAAAGQDVFHYHVHVIPRCPDDGFDVPLPFAGSQMPDRTVLDANAARIISPLRDPVSKRQERRVADEDRRTTSR